jgi:hypothetical protein
MDVKVTANGEAGAGIDWDIDGKKPHESKIHFGKGTGAHTVKFKLHDASGRDLRFDTANPIWDHVSETDCPPKGAKSGQIEVVDCDDRRLTIRNKNSGNACTLHYQLNFVDGGGSAEPVDPIFHNGGGGFI